MILLVEERLGLLRLQMVLNGYLASEYVYSYIGFAPADDPELVMYLAMKRPETGGHDQLGQIYRYVMQNYYLFRG